MARLLSIVVIGASFFQNLCGCTTDHRSDLSTDTLDAHSTDTIVVDTQSGADSSTSSNTDTLNDTDSVLDRSSDNSNTDIESDSQIEIDTASDTIETTDDDNHADTNETTDSIVDTEQENPTDSQSISDTDTFADSSQDTSSSTNDDEDTDSASDDDTGMETDSNLDSEDETDTDAIITEYNCVIVIGPSPFPSDNESFRKFVSMSTSYVSQFDKLQITEVLMKYGSAPNHVSGPPPHYSVRLESDSHDLIEDYYLPFTGVAYPSDGGCFLDITYDGPTISFDFTDRFPRYATIFDIEETIQCNEAQYTGYGGNLAAVDFRPCFERFCAETALNGDPACN